MLAEIAGKRMLDALTSLQGPVEAQPAQTWQSDSKAKQVCVRGFPKYNQFNSV